jgi:hypothetical protein
VPGGRIHPGIDAEVTAKGRHIRKRGGGSNCSDVVIPAKNLFGFDAARTKRPRDAKDMYWRVAQRLMRGTHCGQR